MSVTYIMLSLAFLAGAATVAAQPALKAQTSQGTVVGFLNSRGARQWSGIPYAQPVVGNLRWASPLPGKNFSGGVFNASTTGTYCPQYGFGDEDCLTLNVWAPLTLDTKNFPNGYPVVFFIHGGSLTGGSGGNVVYDLSPYTKKNIVGVTINYRLGTYGWMAATNISGNFGFQDQQLALQWVNKNIKAFGGDPKRVTIQGESAGAFSVFCHLAAETSWPYFQQAIMESPQFVGDMASRQIYLYDDAKGYGDAFVRALGCPVGDIKCLRALPQQNISSLQGKFKYNFYPVVTPGTGIFPRHPFVSFTLGKSANVPILLGSNRDEGSIVVALNFGPLNFTQYFDELQLIANYTASEVLLKYPVNGSDARPALARVFTDVGYYCPSKSGILARLNTFKAMNKTPAPMYAYNFNLVPVNSCLERFDVPSFYSQICMVANLSCHTFEIPFMLNNMYCADNSSWVAPAYELQVSAAMHASVVNFVHTSNPSTGLAKGAPVWPAFNANTQISIGFGTNPAYPYETFSFYKSDVCALWSTLGAMHLLPPYGADPLFGTPELTLTWSTNKGI